MSSENCFTVTALLCVKRAPYKSVNIAKDLWGFKEMPLNGCIRTVFMKK